MLVLVNWIGGGEKEVREGMVQAKMVTLRRYFKLQPLLHVCNLFNSTVYIVDK